MTLLAYAAVERLLRRTPLSGAIIFTAVGLLASGQVAGLITPSHSGHGATLILELTLVLALFTDAMAIHVSSWGIERRLPGRMLRSGLALTMVTGWIVAWPLVPGKGIAVAARLRGVVAP